MRNALQSGSRLDFNARGAVSDEEMHFWTGRNNEQFDCILEQTPSLIQGCRNPRTALSIYLTKMRTGNSNERLASLFNMTRQNLEWLMNKARDCLTEGYVVLHLRMDHRQSYSLHKFQNLLKAFLIVCTYGYIIDVKGPYAATKTDANIMSSIMNNNENPIHILLEPNDVFILDRGFRDSLGDIEAGGYEYHVPPSKDRAESQLTTEQANESRMVTMCLLFSGCTYYFQESPPDNRTQAGTSSEATQLKTKHTSSDRVLALKKNKN
ncbi:unnamed protein product [Euphydryas editha]|uniref:DDE Tnp4 domain-containing protein n=1 Tax=Euphydryas editha TaxID=104508 RepID=A0AAU9UTD1_EUPED|nr:unnamed protein product [Euphydryas editha]